MKSLSHEVPLIAEQKQISNKGGTICSHWNSYILSILLKKSFALPQLFLPYFKVTFLSKYTKAVLQI